MDINDNILITGGAGYIGSHTNKELSQKGLNTIIIDNLVYGHPEFVKWGKFIEGDLNDPDFIRSVFASFSIKAVIHFAAFAYVGESVHEPEKYYSNNVINTLNLLQVMREFGVSQIVFSSTCATYGLPKATPITEDHPQHPINPYGKSKLMVEQVLEDYSNAYGLKHASLRYFNAAGADPDGETGEWHEPETHLIPLVFDVALGKRKQIEIFGTDYDTPDGTCIRDYIHVTDLADAHILALDYLERENINLICNLGNGNGYSVKEVINIAEQVTKKKIQTIDTGPRMGDPPILVGSAEKAKRLLSWEPRYASLEAIIETAWKWHSRK